MEELRVKFEVKLSNHFKKFAKEKSKLLTQKYETLIQKSKSDKEQQ